MNVISDLCELIASWMRSDQIRVSPTTGRLLGLQAGDRFVLRGDAYVVQSREVDDLDSTKQLVYELSSSRGRCRLAVDVSQVLATASGQIVSETGDSMTVFDDDVAMLAAA